MDEIKVINHRREFRPVNPGEAEQKKYTWGKDEFGDDIVVYDGVRAIDQEIQTSLGASVADVVRISQEIGQNIAYRDQGDDIDATSFPNTRQGWSNRLAALQESFESAPLSVREACGFSLNRYADLVEAMRNAKVDTNNQAAPAATTTQEVEK